MDGKEIDRVIMEAKLFLNQNSPPREKYSFGDATLAKAKKFLESNEKLKEPEREIWTAPDGQVHEKIFDPKTGTFILRKIR